MCRSI